MNVIEMRGVVQAYEAGKEVLRGVNLAVRSGEVLGLLGRNGAGKTTLLRTIAGMLAPVSGGTRVFGLDPLRKPLDVKRRIGYVAEDRGLPGRVRLDAMLALHRSLFPDWDDAFADELLGRFGLEPTQVIQTMSLGQARHAALVCAVAHRPDLLLLDEPAGGLDPIARRGFLETSIRLLAESGTTIVLSSHLMSDVERLAGRIAVLHRGKILVDCSLDALADRYALARCQAPDEAAAAAIEGHLDELPEVLGAQRHGRRVCAVVALPPGAASARFAQLGIEAEIGPAAPLEDFFIEVAGRTS